MEAHARTFRPELPRVASGLRRRPVVSAGAAQSTTPSASGRQPAPRATGARQHPAPAPGSRQRGFSLLEVMVALAVLAIGFTALLGLHARNLEIAATERDHGDALLLARSLLAETELAGVAVPGEESGDFETTHPGRYPGWLWQRSVAPTPIPGALVVSVRVVPPHGGAGMVELELVVRGAADAA